VAAKKFVDIEEWVLPVDRVATEIHGHLKEWVWGVGGY
jgi:hypothetical protein